MTLLLGTNSLEYKSILPFFIQERTNKEEKILIISFDDVLGPLINLSRNIGFKMDKLIEKKEIFYFDFSDFGVEDMLQIEIPFISKPPEMFVKSNIEEEIENDINLMKRLVEFIKEKIEKEEIENVIITGIETFLVILEEEDQTKVLRELNGLIKLLKSKKINTIFGLNRDCSDKKIDRYFNTMISQFDRRLFFLENEGGFSKMITGQIMIDVDDKANRCVNKKRIKYRLEDKKVEFFEKLEMN